MAATEQNVGECGGGAGATGPRGDDRGHFFLERVQFKRTAGNDDEHHRFADGSDGLDEFLLAAGETERGARGVLAAHRAIFADAKNHEVGRAGGSNGGSEVVGRGALDRATRLNAQ